MPKLIVKINIRGKESAEALRRAIETDRAALLAECIDPGGWFHPKDGGMICVDEAYLERSKDDSFFKFEYVGVEPDKETTMDPSVRARRKLAGERLLSLQIKSWMEVYAERPAFGHPREQVRDWETLAKVLPEIVTLIQLVERMKGDAVTAKFHVEMADALYQLRPLVPDAN